MNKNAPTDARLSRVRHRQDAAWGARTCIAPQEHDTDAFAATAGRPCAGARACTLRLRTHGDIGRLLQAGPGTLVPSVSGQQVRGGRLSADGRRRPRHGRRWRRGARAKRFARQPGHLAVAEVSAVVAVARSELLRRRLQGRTRSQSEPGPRTAAPTGRWEGLQNWGLRVIQLSAHRFSSAALSPTARSERTNFDRIAPADPSQPSRPSNGPDSPRLSNPR